MAILRHRRRTMPDLAMRLIYSVRTAEDVIYGDELGDDATITFTREPPERWTGHTGRIDAGLGLLPGAGTLALDGQAAGSLYFLVAGTQSGSKGQPDLWKATTLAP